MNRSERRSRSILTTGLLTVLLLLLGGVDKAQAQWSTDSTGTTTITSGKVGVGTTIPAAKLQVTTASNGADVVKLTTGSSASLGGSLSLWSDGSTLTYAFGSNYFFNSTGNSQRYDIGRPAWTWFLQSSSTSGYDNAELYHLNSSGTGSVFMHVDTTGNIGLGLSSPAQKLDVGGAISIFGATVINNNRVLAARSTFNTNTSDGVWSTQATPSTIFTPSNSINTGFIFGYEDDATGKYTPSLGISTPPNASANTRVLQLRQFGGTSPESYNRFEMNVDGKLSWGSGTGAVDASLTHSGAGTMALSGGFNVTGNVGIGTTSPTTKLDVNGNTNITGTLTTTGAINGGSINALYQDVAEWVPATHTLPAGTVVILNPNHSNQVMPSGKSYDTRVAGVVSERPGLTLGEAGSDKALVATTGRVKVMVDATRAPIHVGDLLVTSDEEGVAMKSEPLSLGGTEIHRPGTLIGKALEPLEKGKGVILVLLSLQ